MDIEQDLVQGLYFDFAQLMHFARKVLAVKFAKELSPKQRIEYINDWKTIAVRYAYEWMDGFIEGIVRYSDVSWIEIFGPYEDNPQPFFKAMAKFSEILNEAERKKDEDLKRRIKEGKIEFESF